MSTNQVIAALVAMQLAQACVLTFLVFWIRRLAVGHVETVTFRVIPDEAPVAANVRENWSGSE